MSKSVAKKQKTDLVAEDQVQPLGRGHEEELDREDIQIPRAKLLQALSPEVEADPKTYYPGLIVNSLTGEVLPEVFIPIQKSTEWIFFNPRDKKAEGFNSDYEPGALIWRSTDRNNENVRALGDEAWRHKFMHFLAYFPGHEMPVIVSFSRTSMKAGKKLNTLTKFCGGDMFSRSYKLTTEKETNDQGTYYVLKVTQDSKVDPQSKDFKVAEAWFNDFANKRIEVDVTDDGSHAQEQGQNWEE